METGEPLPDAYRKLGEAGVHLRRGNLAMLAGRSGSMKTMLAADWVCRLRLPTLYLCNDSDEATIAGRLLARSTQRPFEEVSQELLENPAWAASHLAAHENIRWSFDPSPTLESIKLEMDAFGELWGEYPWLMVLDILKNVSYYADSDHASVGQILQYLHTLARDTRASILVVHHASEGSRGLCPSAQDILEKQNQLPTLIITAGVRESYMYLAVVKNRHGSQDPTGNTYLRLRVNPETGQFWES